MAFFCCFFFSSRRRHTRFDCDWSSDVCSSDLSASPRKRLRALPIRSVAFANSLLARAARITARSARSEEHTSELQSQSNLVCRLLLEKKKKKVKSSSSVTTDKSTPSKAMHRQT